MSESDGTPLPQLAPRDANSHKGTFGTVLVVGGSRGMTGAPALTGMAALRGGAGLVRVAVPEVCLDAVAGHEPCYTTFPLPCDSAGRLSPAAAERILEQAAAASVVALGPGLGRSEDLCRLVARLYQEVPQPMVVDADGLNALAEQPGVQAQPGGPRILTPHPGEFARWTGRKTPAEHRAAAAGELATRCSAVVVLKGHETLVTDGDRHAVNATGNPGMATGGTGDILTGLIAALWCQDLAAYDAARLGAYLHGLAGDLAAEELGQVCLVARDLLDFLSDAFELHEVGDG